MSQQTSVEPERVSAENVDVTVPGSGVTLLLEVPTETVITLGVEVSVAGQNLDSFEIHGRIHRNSGWQVIYNAAGDYTSPAGLLIGTSGNLTTIAAAASGWFFMDVTALHSVRVLAGAAADSAVVTARATGGRP